MDFLKATARNAARVLVFALLVAAARGDTLRAKLDLIAPRLRPGAPALAELKIARQGAPLLEGVFDVEVGDGGAPFLRWRTPEFALINGAQAFRVMLPPVPEEARSSSLEAHLRFIAKNGAQFDLGTSPLAGSQSGQLLLGVCVPEGARGQAEIRPVWQSLRLERFRYRDPGGQIALTTTPAFFTPGELPASAAQLLALDAVLISGPAFAQLRERQLQALLRWVDAGGSVCVLVEGQLESAALNFLNQLAADQAPAPPYELDPTGTLGTSAARIGEWRCGLGRAVIVTAPLTLEELDLPGWRDALTFLWKVKAGLAAGLVATGDWMPGEFDPADRIVVFGGAGNSEFLRAMTGLLPETIRPIPWLALAAMLGVFLLAIGPGEYFVLGWLRRRRWTWITFPLSALVCSLGVLRLAERTFGVQDRPASVIITDVGKRGRILRETRFDLLFAADSRESRTELRNAIAVHLQGPSGEPNGADAVSYEGRVPSQYTLCRSLRKWTPTYLRTTSLEGGADLSGVRWEAFDPSLMNYGAPPELVSRMAGENDLNLTFYHQLITHPSGGRATFQPFREPIADLHHGGFFEQISPSGSSSLNDLVLPGARDPRCWVIVARSEHDSEVRLFRYLYFEPR